MKIEFLFIYGKLKKRYLDQTDEEIQSPITSLARTTGILYDYKGDPVLVEDKNGYVYGTLISSTRFETLVRKTDLYGEFNEEDYANSKYIRVMKEVEIVNLGEKFKAWCYVFPGTRREVLEKYGTKIDSGDWDNYIEEKERVIKR